MDPWRAAMLAGDFAAAWQVSDRVLAARRRKPPPFDRPRHLQWLWRGEELAGRSVLVHCYHGLGDTIQFIRLAGLLRARARSVAVWAQPSLAALIASVPGVDRVLPLDDGPPPSGFDVDIELMELPHALRLRPDDLPVAVSYLKPPPLAFACRLPRPAVGIAWRGGDWSPTRSVPAALIARLADCGVPLISLQHGAAAGEQPRACIADFGTLSVAETAALLPRLDLVITVDTMLAHLAGALGVPVWAMLEAEADWRWMSGRDDCPWYPSMRLYRQRRPGDWEPVIAAISADLARLGSGSGTGRRQDAGPAAGRRRPLQAAQPAAADAGAAASRS